MKKTIVIVGGVAGGAGAAARLRRNDEETQIILLEKGDFISYANCGLPYYVGGVIKDQQDLQLQTPASFKARFNIDVRVNHFVSKVDPLTQQVEVLDLLTRTQYALTYDVLILSPGASPIKPHMDGVDLDHVFSLRTIPDTMAITDYIQAKKPKSAVIIGGGFIGLEMAENLHLQGLNISIVEASDHVIGSLDLDMSFDIHNHLRSKGVALYLQSLATSITSGHVVLTSGEKIPGDLVILSIGVTPETKFLENSGIALGERGQILVNQQLQTSMPHIYALGDAIGVKTLVGQEEAIIPLASPANKQARIVADQIYDKPSLYKGTQGTAIAKVFDLTVAVTGENEKSLLRLKKNFQKAYTYSQSHATYYPEAKPMFIKLLFEVPQGNILGAQIVGYDMVDKRIDVLATALRGKMTIFDLQELELAYAPPFSSAKDPVNMIGYVAENILCQKSQVYFIEDLEKLPPDSFLLDLRTPTEYEKGHIPGFINIPLDTIRSRLHEIPQNKTIYLTCQVGLRGYLGEQILKNLGYTCFNLLGGYRHYQAWQKDLSPKKQTYKETLACGLEK